MKFRQNVTILYKNEEKTLAVESNGVFRLDLYLKTTTRDVKKPPKQPQLTVFFTETELIFIELELLVIETDLLFTSFELISPPLHSFHLLCIPFHLLCTRFLQRRNRLW